MYETCLLGDVSTVRRRENVGTGVLGITVDFTWLGWFGRKTHEMMKHGFSHKSKEKRVIILFNTEIWNYHALLYPFDPGSYLGAPLKSLPACVHQMIHQRRCRPPDAMHKYDKKCPVLTHDVRHFVKMESRR